MQEALGSEPSQEDLEEKKVLLAVDLGLRTGLAVYNDLGHLMSYRSHHFKRRSDLKRAVWGILGELPRLDALIMEGDRSLGALWQKAATKRFEMLRTVRVIGAEVWRAELLLPRQQQRGSQAKEVAGVLAREIIAQSPACQGAKSLRHDTAEAILIGAWGVQHVGWLDED